MYEIPISISFVSYMDIAKKAHKTTHHTHTHIYRDIKTLLLKIIMPSSSLSITHQSLIINHFIIITTNKNSSSPSS